jgi:transposase
MSQNFLPCERDQQMLLPTDMREWLGEDHLAWFVLDAVAEIDLSPFFGDYRDDGWGRAAHDPEMMVALLLYAYAVGERSSRKIERRLSEDVAFRVIAANQAPDHSTIARFRARHEDQLAELFGEVLGLCAKAGLVSVGTIALDGTRIRASNLGSTWVLLLGNTSRCRLRPPSMRHADEPQLFVIAAHHLLFDDTDARDVVLALCDAGVYRRSRLFG